MLKSKKVYEKYEMMVKHCVEEILKKPIETIESTESKYHEIRQV
jgi:hypothetical protein